MYLLYCLGLLFLASVANAAESTISPKSAYDQAISYQNGDGVTQDLKKSFELFLQSAQSGYPKAEYKVAIAYFTGEGTAKNKVEGLAWMYKAVDAGLPNSLLVSMVKEIGGEAAEAADNRASELVGLSNEPSSEEVNYLLEKRADSGDLDAQYKYALHVGGFVEDSETAHQKAFPIFLKYAKQGNVDCEKWVANAYINGMGTRSDFDEGIKWFTIAGNHGDIEAQRTLGNIYSINLKDYSTSFEWYLKAAYQGDDSSTYQVGWDNFNGIGTPKNEIEGLAWLYVANASSNGRWNKVVGEMEERLGGTAVSAAQQRGSQLQSQIKSLSQPSQ